MIFKDILYNIMTIMTIMDQPKTRIRTKKINYCCPRCGYDTDQKGHMRKHLYITKKDCPGIINDIEMSDAVKEHILKNRIYKIATPKTENRIINQTINNYNAMNNIVNNIDTMEKLNTLMTYTKCNLVPFENRIDERFSKAREMLEQDRHDELMQNDIIKIVDDVSQITDKIDIVNMSIYYDKVINKLKIYDDSGSWQESILFFGIQHMIQKIQEYYWHFYEAYLIRKINCTTGMPLKEKNRMMELLSEYYNFLVCVDVDPFVKERSNNQIIYTPDDSRYFIEPWFHNEEAFTLTEKHMKEYNAIKDKVGQSKKNKVCKQLVDLIKSNTKKNEKELNDIICSMLNVDDEFKNIMLTSTFGPATSHPINL